MKCPKCKAKSGNDWSQCGGSCPMTMSPHYKENGNTEEITMTVRRSDIRKALLANGHDQVLVEKGLKKAERWMRAAYGEVNWTELQNETGDAVGTVVSYMMESKEKPDGRNTFNRNNRN